MGDEYRDKESVLSPLRDIRDWIDGSSNNERDEMLALFLESAYPTTEGQNQ